MERRSVTAATSFNFAHTFTQHNLQLLDTSYKYITTIIFNIYHFHYHYLYQLSATSFSMFGRLNILSLSLKSKQSPIVETRAEAEEEERRRGGGVEDKKLDKGDTAQQQQQQGPGAAAQ